MNRPVSLLDTDTLSEVMKGKHATVARKATVYLTQHGAFTFSLMAPTSAASLQQA